MPGFNLRFCGVNYLRFIRAGVIENGEYKTYMCTLSFGHVRFSGLWSSVPTSLFNERDRRQIAGIQAGVEGCGAVHRSRLVLIREECEETYEGSDSRVRRSSSFEVKVEGAEEEA